MKKAVDSGYWPLYRFNPLLEKEGKNPFILDSKAPDGTLQEFLANENRFAVLEKISPEGSKKLRAQIDEEIKKRYQALALMADPKSICDDEATAEKDAADKTKDDKKK